MVSRSYYEEYTNRPKKREYIVDLQVDIILLYINPVFISMNGRFQAWG